MPRGRIKKGEVQGTPQVDLEPVEDAPQQERRETPGEVVTDPRQARDAGRDDLVSVGQRLYLERGGVRFEEPPEVVVPSPAIATDADTMVELQALAEDAPAKLEERSRPAGVRTPEDQARVEREGMTPDEAVAEPPRSAAELQRQGIERWRGGGEWALRDEEVEERGLPEGGVPEEERVAHDPLSVAANVGRNVAEEPARLIRRADAPEGGPLIDPATRFNVDPTPRDAAEDQERHSPRAYPPGERHDPDAPWPGVSDAAAAAPSASPEPGPEPSVQYNPPQDVAFRAPPGAVVGLPGPSAEEQWDRQEKATREAGTASRANPTAAAAADRAAEEAVVSDRAVRKGYSELAREMVGVYLDSVPPDQAPSWRHLRAALAQAEKECRGRGWGRLVRASRERRGGGDGAGIRASAPGTAGEPEAG